MRVQKYRGLTGHQVKSSTKSLFLGSMYRNRFVSFCFSLLLIAATHAQSFEQILDQYPVRSIGPSAMSGRVTAIAVPSHQPQTIYAGTASGGVWKSDNGGIAWKPIFDEQSVQSIGSVAVNPLNNDEVWVGTGEGNPRNSHNSGAGLYRSLDGGRTWTFMGLENTKTLHRIVINPQDPRIIHVAAMGSVWGPNSERGVYRSTDGGATWKLVLSANATTGCAELVQDLSNPNKLLAALWDFERKPYTFRSGGPGSGLHMSVDGGATWTRLNSDQNGMPKGDLGRIGIAISASEPNRVYAIIEAAETGVYRSNDGGYHWSLVSTEANAGNRPFYYHEIYCDPKNENRLYSIWSQVSVSEDGGKHWDILADWGEIHPDHHAFYINPADPKHLINGNDGGLNISYDGGQTWRYAENIPVGQFYHVAIDNDLPYHIYGGLQDNGSWRGPAYQWVRGPIRSHNWQELLFGDGFDVQPHPGNSMKGYAMYQGGNVYRYNLETQESVKIKPEHPGGWPLRYNWNAAIALHPSKPDALYFGSQYLHYSEDEGRSWRIISPDLTTNDTSKLHQAESGGLTIDATNAENYCSIIAIGNSAADENVLWVGTDDGNVQLSRDHGTTWANVAKNIKGLPKNAWIPYLYVSPKNPGECWVVANNYRQNDFAPYLFKTSDYGKTWVRLATPDQVKGHCLSVLPDQKNANLVFLGTDRGLWVSQNAGATWTRWKQFPACPVQDLKWQARENDLVVGTFGRSLFVVDDLSALQAAAGNQAQQGSVHIYNTTTGYLVDFAQPSGVRFGADGEFAGQNRPGGSMITLWVNGEKGKKIEATGLIYNDQGQRVRRHEMKFDSSGLYRIPYRLIQDGVLLPSHGNHKEGETLPPGLPLAPGNYKMVIKVGNDSSSVSLKVLPSPLTHYDPAARQRLEANYQRFAQSADRGYKLFEGLKEAEKLSQTWLNQAYDQDSVQAYLKKSFKPIADSLATLKGLFMLPADYRPYEEATLRVMDRYESAISLLNGDGMENAEFALANLERHLDSVAKRSNAFFEGDWKKWINEVQQFQQKSTPELGGY